MVISSNRVLSFLDEGIDWGSGVPRLAALTNNGTIQTDFNLRFFGIQGNGTCTLNGNANQFGQIYQIPSATYTCGAVGSTLQALLGALLLQRWVGTGRLF